MKEYIKLYIQFFRKHSEFLIIPIGIIIWVISPYILRWFDQSAGSHDIGKLQIFILAAVGLFFATGSVWISLRLTMFDVYSVFDDFIKKYKNELTVWQVAKFSLSLFALLLLSYVAILMVLA